MREQGSGAVRKHLLGLFCCKLFCSHRVRVLAIWSALLEFNVVGRLGKSSGVVEGAFVSRIIYSRIIAAGVVSSELLPRVENEGANIGR